jgi:hypothetical protein
MLQVVPNSHRWTDLNQIITSIEYDELRRNAVSEDNIKYLDEPLTVEYLLIGFQNTLKSRTKLVFNGEYELLRKNISTLFTSVEKIIDYLEYYVNENNKTLEEWSIDRFKGLIQNTIDCGFNLKEQNKMDRQEVYRRIDTERQYQDLRWTPRREKNETPDEEKPPAEWINYMEFHLAEAKKEVYFLNEEEALAQVRKVAALAVRCLELHGCPERVIPEELFDGE